MQLGTRQTGAGGIAALRINPVASGTKRDGRDIERDDDEAAADEENDEEDEDEAAVEDADADLPPPGGRKG